VFALEERDQFDHADDAEDQRQAEVAVERAVHDLAVDHQAEDRGTQ
jgi:hypothetical protein